VVQGGTGFETNGDTVYFENENGPANNGRLVQRTLPRIVTAGQDSNGHTLYAPDVLNGDPVTDTFLDLQGAGLGIDTAGQTNGAGQTYFGVEMAGVENVQLRLSSGNAHFTINDDTCVGTCTFSGANGPITPPLLPAPVLNVYGGAGDDSITVNGIGAPTTIRGGPGIDAITVQSPADDLTSILSRLTVDGNNDLVTQVTHVLDNDSQQVVQTFLSTPILVEPVSGTCQVVPNQTGSCSGSTSGSAYYQAEFVPILQDPDTANSGTALNVRTVIINPDGSLLQKLVQQRGVAEFGTQAVGVQKRDSSNNLLWLDAKGNETTTNTTGIQAILILQPTDAGYASALPIFLDSLGHQTTTATAIPVIVDVSTATTTSASFTQPGVGGTVSVAIHDSSWLTVGQHVTVVTSGTSAQGPPFVNGTPDVTDGTYSVSSIADGTHAVLTLLAGAGVAAGSVVAGGASVVPEGARAVFVDSTFHKV